MYYFAHIYIYICISRICTTILIKKMVWSQQVTSSAPGYECMENRGWNFPTPSYIYTYIILYIHYIQGLKGELPTISAAVAGFREKKNTKPFGYQLSRLGHSPRSTTCLQFCHSKFAAMKHEVFFHHTMCSSRWQSSEIRSQSTQVIRRFEGSCV